MITVQEINRLAAMRHWIDPLLESHYDELCTDKAMVLNPDWERYAAMLAAGNLVMVAAFDDDRPGFGNCVGYTFCFLSPHIHYKDTLVAWNDVLFLHKDYRTGSAGSRLMKATALACAQRGVKKLLWHAKPGTALDTIMAKRRPLFEKVYAQDL